MAGRNERRGKGTEVLNILLVQDDETEIKIIIRAFGDLGHMDGICVVRSGEEAIEYICGKGSFSDRKKHPYPGLILLDIDMPGMDGLNVLEKLKKETEHDHIPVVMFTSSDDRQDILTAFKNGAAGYMLKPVDYNDMFKTVSVINDYWRNVSMTPQGSFSDL